MFKRDQNLLMILMLNLLYPAVLGSIFYSVLGNLQATMLGRSEVACLLMMGSVMIFFSIDFLYTFVHEHYSLLDFLVDIVILIVMFKAFDSVNFLLRTPNPSRYALCLGATFAIFVMWDIPRRRGIGSIFFSLITFESLMALCFLAAAFFHCSLEIVGVLSVIASLIMAILFKQLYGDRRTQLLR